MGYPVRLLTYYINSMPDEYTTRTLNAYNADPKKYEDATKEVILHEEIEEFMARIPNKELPVLDVGCAFGRDTALLARTVLRQKALICLTDLDFGAVYSSESQTIPEILRVITFGISFSQKPRRLCSASGKITTLPASG